MLGVYGDQISGLYHTQKSSYVWPCTWIWKGYKTLFRRSGHIFCPFYFNMSECKNAAVLGIVHAEKSCSLISSVTFLNVNFYIETISVPQSL